MTRQRCLIGVGVLTLIVLTVLGVRAPEPVQAAPAAEHSFDKNAALKVAMRSQALHFEFLTEPEVKRLGGRAFLVGRRVTSPTWVYLPVDEVSYIEEYSSLEKMQKTYRDLGPKKDDLAKPDLPPKKN